ncbi:CLUMA_CG007098, isoform A [Clunio marinus]|uniref:CLUMA_CG007098, isoform A n=1 Tax=Clunio marinus TaxID=568069 RepID=A0A1J1HZW6_9DIPT|nr:CLUMA_CG007098, isoform A [Clunio marinus]
MNFKILLVFCIFLFAFVVARPEGDNAPDTPDDDPIPDDPEDVILREAIRRPIKSGRITRGQRTRMKMMGNLPTFVKPFNRD